MESDDVKKVGVVEVVLEKAADALVQGRGTA